jgi:hypothetical protein
VRGVTQRIDAAPLLAVIPKQQLLDPAPSGPLRIK